MKKRNSIVAILLSVMLTVGSVAGTVSAAEAVVAPDAAAEQLLTQEVSREDTADAVSGDEAASKNRTAEAQGATDEAANETAVAEESTDNETAGDEATVAEESTDNETAGDEAAVAEESTDNETAGDEAVVAEESTDNETEGDESATAQGATDEAADESEAARKAAAATQTSIDSDAAADQQSSEAQQQPGEVQPQPEQPQAQAQQDQSEQPQDQPEEIVLIEYNGIEILTAKPATQSATPLAKSGQTCQTLSDALGYVRGQMIARQEEISVTVPESVFGQLDLLYYDDLLAHTGDPRGGDYLRSALTYMGASYTWTEDESSPGEILYQVYYYFGYKTDADEEAAADAEVSRLKTALGLGSSSAKTDYEKVKAIHDYLVENVEYDYDTYYGTTTDYPGTYTGYGALVNHLAVCQGFAAAFYRLCLEAGIDARLIDSNEMCHAWNIVQLDDLYYLMDCTWDENTNSDDYFLRGKYDFTDHANSDDQFSDSAFASKYPLSDYKYGFTIHSLGTAPDYTLITQDRRTVSTAAQNGRAKVLVFFLDGCGRFLYTMETLRGKEYDGVDFVYANMTHYLTQEQQEMLTQIGNEMPDDVPGTYAICANGNDARDEFEDICGLDDGSGYIYSASVFLIDPDNQILYAENAYAGDIGTLVEAILEDSDLPEAPAPGEDPYAGFTAIGLCGKNAVWRYYGSDGGAYGKGSLLITGSGAMWDNWYTYTPIGWLADGQSEDYSLSNENIQANQVKKLIVDTGITSIGSGDLKDFTSLQSITFKGSAPAIDSGHGLTRNIRIYFPEDDASWDKVDKSLFSSGCKWISQDANGVHHHKWGSWTVTKPATMTEEGTKERTCTECKEKETETIPKIDGVLPGKTTRGDLFNLANSVKVTWNAVPGAKYYKVYREGITNPKESVAEPVIVTTKLVGGDNKPGLVNGHAYRYRIVASLTGAGDPSGDSPLSYSKIMYRLQTTAWKYVKNTAPGKVTASYKKSPTGDGYVLLYADNQDMVGAKSKVILGADTTAVVLGGFTKGKTYWFQIRVRKKVNGIAYYTTFGTKKAVKITQ